MHAARARYPQNGFTLIELLVVMLILALVAGLGLPSFIEAIARNRIVGQNNELQAGLMLARSEAIRRNGNVALCAANAAQDNCQAAWERNWLVWQDLNADGDVDAGEPILQVGGVSRNEGLSAADPGDTVIRFSARGMLAFPEIDPDDPVAPVPEIRIRAVKCPAGQRLERRISVTRIGVTESRIQDC